MMQNVTFLKMGNYLCSPVNEPVSRDKYETGKTSDGLGKSEFRVTWKIQHVKRNLLYVFHIFASGWIMENNVQWASFYCHVSEWNSENLHSYFIGYFIMFCIFRINILWHSISIFMINLLGFSPHFLPLGKYTVTFQNYFLSFWGSNFSGFFYSSYSEKFVDFF